MGIEMESFISRAPNTHGYLIAAWKALSVLCSILFIPCFEPSKGLTGLFALCPLLSNVFVA